MIELDQLHLWIKKKNTYAKSVESCSPVVSQSLADLPSKRGRHRDANITLENYNS